MTKLEHALAAAKRGFYVFPLEPNTKLPAISDWPNLATRKVETIRRWWIDDVTGLEYDFNIGICTTRFRDHNGKERALLVIDVDNKRGKHGDSTIAKIESQGFILPSTLTVDTPTGGRHLYFSIDHAIRQGVNTLGDGVDTRSYNGLVVAAGSTIALQEYIYSGNSGRVVSSPSWLVERAGRAVDIESDDRVDPKILPDQAKAWERGLRYVRDVAEIAVEGSGGDHTTYVVCSHCKDIGLSMENTFKLLCEEWTSRCRPPWGVDELRVKVENAYKYGENAIGSSRPELDFPELLPEETKTDTKKNPILELNKEYAYIMGKSFILWEHGDRIDYLKPSAFVNDLANRKIQVGDKVHSLPKMWIESKQRRTYDGLTFMPGKDVPSNSYNLWKGWTVERNHTGPKKARDSLEAWKEHLLENICDSDPSLARWLTAYFAQLIQQPWKKPLTSIVIYGGKGVGKNVLVECVGYILGNSFKVTSNKRHLMGNFNSIYENCLMIVFDEAFWSGDKQAEGSLKDLITGTNHMIERKGFEAYMVPNLTRVVVIGNEPWMVPATGDERRFAVFSVGDRRKQDVAFFRAMVNGMEAGGYSMLLDYLHAFDTKGIDLSVAPITNALLLQKEHSLSPIEKWWFESLYTGGIEGALFEGTPYWPSNYDGADLAGWIDRYFSKKRISSRRPSVKDVHKFMQSVTPSGYGMKRKNRVRNGKRTKVYLMPSLKECRDCWDVLMGGRTQWD